MHTPNLNLLKDIIIYSMMTSWGDYDFIHIFFNFSIFIMILHFPLSLNKIETYLSVSYLYHRLCL